MHLPKINFPKIIPQRLTSHKWVKITIRTALILFILLLIAGISGTVIGSTLKTPIKAVASSAGNLSIDFQNKDLISAKKSLQTLQTDINTLDEKYKIIAWSKVIPFFW